MLLLNSGMNDSTKCEMECVTAHRNLMTSQTLPGDQPDRCRYGSPIIVVAGDMVR